MTHFNSLRPLGLLISLLGLSSFALLGAACSTAGTSDEPAGEHVDSAEAVLTAAQCSFFDVNGKNQVCHYTGSASHPYTIIKTSEQGCINGHAGHAGDYITSTDPSSPTYDPTCNGGGCLPAGAPTDPTVGCCDGLVSQNGTCVDLCAGVTCAASDQCHAAGTCNPANGTCDSPAAADGTACTDGNACSVTDACVAGTCTGSTNPCQNGGSCADGGNSFTCSCPSGYTGTNCEIAACAPTTCAAQGATCGTIPDGCGGTLTCGGACASGCPCEALPAWQEFVAAMSYDTCFHFAPNDIYLRGVASFAVGDGSVIRTGMFAQPPNEMVGDPQQCGAVSTQSGFQSMPVNDAQLLACVQSIVQSSGGFCQ